MDYAPLIGGAIQFLEFLFEKLHNTTGVEVTDEAKAALESLKKYHGTLVTKASLDSLRG